ncbi:MAG: phosphatidate cytidylyltransferase [Wenzhouxiangellaceae bacterium]
MLKQRLITALVLAPGVIAIIFLLPNPWLQLLLAVILLGGAIELGRLAGLLQTAALGAYLLLTAALMLALYLHPDWRFSAMVVATALWLPLLLWLSRSGTGTARHGGWRLLKAAAGMVVIVPAWLALGDLQRHHPLWLLGLLLVVWAADVGAYAAGKTLGRHKLAPRISPGKTIEGLLGGLLVAALVGWIYAWLNGYAKGHDLLIIGLIIPITLVSVGGDLLISLFKRHAGSKDTGQLLPGHGGLMDRIDSLCAAAPFYWLAVALWQGWR